MSDEDWETRTFIFMEFIKVQILHSQTILRILIRIHTLIDMTFSGNNETRTTYKS